MNFRKVYGLAQKSRLLGEEYEAFGADLGVDLSKRVFYDWVVVEYARAQIPEPWVAYSDDGGRTFYHNHLKEETQWEHPLRNTFYALLGKCRPDPSVNQYYHDLFNNLKPTLKQPQG